MRFIDSNIIAYAFYQNEYQDHCQTVLQNEGLITDTIALVEAFNIIEWQTDRDFAIKAIRSILRSRITIIAADINIIFEALKKSDKYQKLKFIDLFHYTVASLKNCESLVSYDKDFDHLEISRVETV